MDLIHLQAAGLPKPLSKRCAVDCHLGRGGEKRKAGEKNERRRAGTHYGGKARCHFASPFAYGPEALVHEKIDGCEQHQMASILPTSLVRSCEMVREAGQGWIGSMNTQTPLEWVR